MEELEYTILVELDEEDGGYVASVPVLPGCLSEGASIDNALANIREAIELYLEGLKERGIAAPRERTSPQLYKVTVVA